MPAEAPTSGAGMGGIPIQTGTQTLTANQIAQVLANLGLASTYQPLHANLTAIANAIPIADGVIDTVATPNLTTVGGIITAAAA